MNPAAAPHVPVLLAEVIAGLAPHSGERHVDGTYGAGGYARALLATGAEVIDSQTIRYKGKDVLEVWQRYRSK